MIKAVFKGRDNSLGYKKGKKYELHFGVSFSRPWVARTNLTGMCSYDSLRKFLDNWDVV